MVNKNNFLIDLSKSVLSRDFEDQTDIQKVFTAIWALEGEVNNGGFHQYFWNSAGNTANFAPVALRRIGANTCAGIVERALRIVSSEPLPDDSDSRDKLLDGLSREAIVELEAIDVEFFSYPDDLTALLFDFVRAHPEV